MPKAPRATVGGVRATPAAPEATASTEQPEYDDETLQDDDADVMLDVTSTILPIEGADEDEQMESVDKPAFPALTAQAMAVRLTARSLCALC